ncbi:MAG: hypothetical protein S4CHLAM37_01520 [Chlamydiia bacterium]|nr:hypothetical protein [Chlamydiia bacterium]
MKVTKLLICLVYSSSLLFAERELTDTGHYEPFFDGTILEFSSSNQGAGQVSLQPFLYSGAYYGLYANDWSMQTGDHFAIINPQIWGYIGITNYMQFEFVVESTTTYFKSKNTTHFGDIQAGFGFQFMWEEKGTPKPNLRFVVLETFPTGAYKNLNPHFQSNDATGFGSYQTSLVLVAKKNFWTIPNHAFNVNVSLDYTYFHKANIQGVNMYGGARNTGGTIWPGDTLMFTFSTEYFFIQTPTFELGFAIDMQYTTTFTKKFRGFKGTLANGQEAFIEHKAEDLFSILPAIEFAFSPNLAAYIGGFFSVTGRNTNSFAQGVLSVVGSF